MKTFPKPAAQTAHNALLWAAAQNIPRYAAYAAYFLVLSVFPALLLVMSSLRFTGLQVEYLVEILHNVVPQALWAAAERLVYSAWNNASATMAGVSAAIALWSASKGIYGLLVGLNAVYGVSESRGYFYTRGISVVYSVGFLLVLLLTLVLHVFGNMISVFLLQFQNPVINYFLGILNLRLVLLIVLQTLLFTLMFMFLPNRRNGFWASLPGGLLCSVGWLTFSNLYSLYVGFFTRYTSIYGSLYAISISLLWLYFCMSILFYGGALNSWLSRHFRRRQDEAQ